MRGDAALYSALEQIPGIGKTRVRLLLKTYGGLDKLALASVEELSDLKGMNVKAAESIVSFLRQQISENRHTAVAERDITADLPERVAEISTPESSYKHQEGG